MGFSDVVMALLVINVSLVGFYISRISHSLENIELFMNRLILEIKKKK